MVMMEATQRVLQQRVDTLIQLLKNNRVVIVACIVNCIYSQSQIDEEFTHLTHNGLTTQWYVIIVYVEIINECIAYTLFNK